MNKVRRIIFLIGVYLLIGQTHFADFIAYNDFGAPRYRNNSVSRVGATAIEIKNSEGNVVKVDKLIDSATKKSSSVELKLTIISLYLSQDQ